MPENKKQIKLTVPELIDTICHGCCSDGGTVVVNPKMACPERRSGRFCPVAIRIGNLVCKKTSLENLTYFEEFKA